MKITRTHYIKTLQLKMTICLKSSSSSSREKGSSFLCNCQIPYYFWRFFIQKLCMSELLFFHWEYSLLLHFSFPTSDFFHKSQNKEENLFKFFKLKKYKSFSFSNFFFVVFVTQNRYDHINPLIVPPKY